MDVRLEDDRIRRYLLADLPEVEQQLLEEQLFGDHDLFEHVCAVEADLIDEYVRGELPGAMRRQFETGFLASQVQRDKIELARALQKAVFNPAPAGVSLGRRWPRWSLAAAAVFVAAVGTLFLWNQQRSGPGEDRQAQQPLPGPPVQPAAKPPGTAPGVSTVLAVRLAGGLLRDLAGGNRVNVDARIETLRFVLEIDPGSRPSRYRVVIETAERKRILTRDDVERAPTGEPTVTVDAPASAFPDADYIVFLQTRNEGANRFRDVQEYFFSVRRNLR